MSFLVIANRLTGHSRFAMHLVKQMKYSYSVCKGMRETMLWCRKVNPVDSHSVGCIQCLPTRYYAKGKDKKKSDKGKKAKVHVSEAEMSEVINIRVLKSDLETEINHMREEFAKQLSLRSAAGTLETYEISIEGESYPLGELAQVIRKNPQLMVIHMTAFPQYTKTVVEALQQSGMNLNPQQEGTTIYVPVPKVTKDHREQLAKSAKAMFIKCRDSIKDVQNHFIKEAKKKEETHSVDLIFSVQQQIMSLAEEYIVAAEKLLESKKEELLGK